MAGGGRVAGRGGGSVSRGLAQVADPDILQWGDSLAQGEWIVREAFTVSQYCGPRTQYFSSIEN